MKKDKRKKSISLTVIITLIISLCMLIPCLVSGAYMYVTIKNQAFRSIEKTLDTSAESAFEALDSKLYSVKNTYYTIISDPIVNPELYNYIYPGSTSSFSESIIERLTKMMFYNTSWNEDVLSSVTLTNDLHTFHYISNTKSGSYLDQADLSFFKEILLDYEKLTGKTENQRINLLIHSQSSEDSVIYYRDYYSYPENQFKGLLSLRLNEKELMSVFNDLQEKYTNTLCFVYDSSETVIASNNAEIQNGTISRLSVNNIPLSEMMTDSDNYIVHSAQLDSFPLTVSVLIPLQPIYHELQEQLNGFFIIFSVLLVAVVFIALVVSRSVSSYINLLIRRMTLLGQGDYSLTLPLYGIRELNNLSETFTGMSKKIQWLLNEKYANEVLLKESELKALQAQINPHFLFNTLLSISWTARNNNDMECYDMITSLSSLLKANIYTSSSKFVSLSDELKTVQHYLKIQKIRFGQKFSYDIDIDKRLADKPILKLCLQPIVENAVTHGLENKLEDGMILISGDLSEDSNEMVLKISDNGVGFHSDTLNETLQDLNALSAFKNEKPPSGHSHHIGLINTQLRLKYTYGEQYGITIKSVPGTGTTVAIHLPAEYSFPQNMSIQENNNA